MAINRIIKKVKERGIKNGIVYLFINPVYTIAARIYKQYLKRHAVIDDHQILFYSSPSYSDNSWILYCYLRKRLSDEEKTGGSRWTFIWIINREDERTALPYNTKSIKRNSYWYRNSSLASYRAFATSKYIFFTHPVKRNYYVHDSAPDQLIVNLWHGCGYKDAEKLEKSWSEIYPFDIALVPGRIFIDTKSRFWDCGKDKIWDIGYPRYDLFMNRSESAELYSRLLRDNNRLLIIWRPTFRNTGSNIFPEESIDYVFDLPLLKSKNELEQLNEKCKRLGILLCIKRHPKQKQYLCEKENYSNIRFISNTDLKESKVELYSLLTFTDAMISDYSSAAVDYMLLNKPMAFALDDFTQYKNTRGFVFEDPLAYMPGYHLYTWSDFSAFLDDIAQGKDIFSEERNKLMNDMHNPCGNYCERIWERIRGFKKY